MPRFRGTVDGASGLGGRTLKSGGAWVLLALAARALILWPGCLLFGAAPAGSGLPSTEADVPATVQIRTFLDRAREWGEEVRVRVEGTVTHSISDRTFFIQDETAGVYVFQKPERAYRVGERVEVVGFPSLGGFAPTLHRCVSSPLGMVPVPEPVLLSGREALVGTHTMELVRIRGRTAAEHFMQGRLLFLRPEDGAPVVGLNLEAVTDLSGIQQIEPGSLLEVTGVAHMRLGPDRKAGAATLFLRDGRDVLVLAGPPFWTLGRAARLLAGTGLAVVLLLTWVLTLRATVKRQTALVEQRFEREAALRASEDRFAKVFRTSPDPVMIVRAEGQEVLDVNPAFERLSGFRRDEVVGRRADSPGLWVEPAECARALELLNRQGSVPNFECVQRSREGREIRCLVSLEWIELNGERCWMGVTRDVTVHREAEEQRQALQTQLQQAQRLEALGTLAGGIAHDFNNILGVILTHTDLAEQDVEATHPACESLQEVRKAGLRARGLVRQILSFGRHEPHSRRRLHLGPVVEEAVRLLRAAVPASIGIHTELDPASQAVLADPGSIHQIIANLGSNAWHAMERRPGSIRIRVQPVRVDGASAPPCSGLRPGAYTLLSVADEGAGMDQATRERIFDPFFTTKEPGKGTGLGLAVVHGIVKDHGGVITVTSEQGRGSEFCIYFPALPKAEDAELLPTIAGERPLGANQHILLVDDEPSLAGGLKRLLERLGYSVTEFTDSRAAIRHLRQPQVRIDLVLTDLNMPGASGIDVITEARALSPPLPVVLFSGFITAELRAEALRAGAGALLLKPVVPDELAAALHRVLAAQVGPAGTVAVR